jgi:NAD-dependent SIR2 family protein deacetylase
MSSMNQQQELEKAARHVGTADMLLVVTGAGMGVDSGLPDFRGNAGFWRAYPALGRNRIDFTSIASPQAFREQPRMAWGFYGHRLNLYRQTMPHRGYDILKKWGDKCQYGSMSFTSNVDGHFQRAGFDDEKIVECHGSIHHLQCLAACTDSIWNNEFVPQVDEENCLLRNDPPLCPLCGGLARPNILMFGDIEWVDQRTRAQHDRLRHWLKDAERLLVIEIGAGTAVTTTRDFTQQVAFHFGAPVIRINPQDAAIHGHPSHVSLSMGGLDALVAIDALLSS